MQAVYSNGLIIKSNDGDAEVNQILWIEASSEKEAKIYSEFEYYS
jgi:hypothetical protein